MNHMSNVRTIPTWITAGLAAGFGAAAYPNVPWTRAGVREAAEAFLRSKPEVHRTTVHLLFWARQPVDKAELLAVYQIEDGAEGTVHMILESDDPNDVDEEPVHLRMPRGGAAGGCDPGVPWVVDINQVTCMRCRDAHDRHEAKVEAEEEEEIMHLLLAHGCVACGIHPGDAPCTYAIDQVTCERCLEVNEIQETARKRAVGS